MAFVWHLPFSQGLTRGTIDTSCFSRHFDSLSEFDAGSELSFDDSLDDDTSFFKLVHIPIDIPIEMAKGKSKAGKTVRLDTDQMSNKVMDTRARYNLPSFPPPMFLTTLLEPQKFNTYIKNEFRPSLPIGVTDESTSVAATTTKEDPLYEARDTLTKSVNATHANTLLHNQTFVYNPTDSEWIRYTVFRESDLPGGKFIEDCLADVPDIWDENAQRFSNFPQSMTEENVRNWLNHLAHTLAVKHGLVKKTVSDGDVGGESGNVGGDSDDSDDADSDFDDDGKPSNSDDASTTESEELGVPVESGNEMNGFIVDTASDRSFSVVAYKKGPSGGFRYRKPDIILLNTSLRRFLEKNSLRPRWQQVEAFVEVSSSCSRENMIAQIIQKTSLMFEAQAHRRFVLALAIRGRSDDLEYAFFLIDRAGVCSPLWKKMQGFGATFFARIIFALCFANPEIIGVDTTMTRDPFSGDVTKVKVGNVEYDVLKHIHSSLILFGRGTHILVVQDKDKNCHVLKDAWLRLDQGISEIDILSRIRGVLEQDQSLDAEKHRRMHSRFIAGVEIGDSTALRRGRIPKSGQPPERVHRRVVTGPLGDPITTFRSRREFFKVMLDCVKWLKYLHTKCNLVHGDISVNNIVIHREPQNVAKNKVNTATAVLGAGSDEDIPVVGVVIDYDYARNLGTVTTQTSGTPPFMPIAALAGATRATYIHQPANDLESLLQTMVGIMVFTDGPCAAPTSRNDEIPTARWYNESDMNQLARDKTLDVVTSDLPKQLSPYWQPFSEILGKLITETYDTSSASVPLISHANHDSYIKLIKKAIRLSKTSALRETPGKYAAVVPGLKRSRSSKDVGKWPYKIARTEFEGRSAWPADITPIAQWGN